MRLATKIIISAAFLFISAAVNAQSGHAEQLRASYEGKQAKYIFLFIGDGMGLAQVNTTEAFLGAGKNTISMNTLNMSEFEVQSFMTTYSEDRFITGSAASGTAIATGKKTTTGTISMDSKHEKNYKTIAEKAKENGYKVGILTSVPINHATPAVFYSHEPVRHNYYNIGKQLPASGFDFFGGGGFKDPQGREGDQESLIGIAKEQGYRYVDDKRAIRRLSPEDGKVIAVNPRISGGAMPYAIDMTREDVSLADFTGKAIEMLDNDDGFFMMVEGGKIDWAGHANDAASIIHDMIDFDKAIGEALDFYKKHPDETLIIVTSDHETGGMSVGSRSAKYASFYEKLKYQQVSQERFAALLDETEAAGELTFEKALEMAKKYFGYGKKSNGFKSTAKDDEMLKHAFNIEFGKKERQASLDAVAASYIGDHSFTSQLLRIVNEKSGVSFTTNSHTAQAVPVKVQGVGASLFSTYLDNTDISKNIEAVLISKQIMRKE